MHRRSIEYQVLNRLRGYDCLGESNLVPVPRKSDFLPPLRWSDEWVESYWAGTIAGMLAHCI